MQNKISLKDSKISTSINTSPDGKKLNVKKSETFVIPDSLPEKFENIKNQILIQELYPPKEMKGKNLLITCGGYTAKLEWVKNWTKELYNKKLKDYNIGLVIVVIGPKDAYYIAREVDAAAMAKRYVEAYQKYGLNNTILIAHSSGVFPAHHFFDALYSDNVKKVVKKGKKKETVNLKMDNADKKGITRNKIIYVELDGELGMNKGGYLMTQNMVNNLRKIISVYAVDSATNTNSGMYHEAIKIKQRFPDKTIDYLLTTKTSGCAKGAKWCVHDVMITTKPHNPKTYDLQNDYQLFDKDRQVVTEYMEAVDTLISR